jgi:hypothetical protein
VILQRNINVGNGLVNGAQGVIDRFIEYDRAYQQGGSSSEDDTKDRILVLRSDQVKTSCAISVATLSPLCSRWSCPTTTRILATIFLECIVDELAFRKPHSLLRTQIRSWQAGL